MFRCNARVFAPSAQRVGRIIASVIKLPCKGKAKFNRKIPLISVVFLMAGYHLIWKLDDGKYIYTNPHPGHSSC
jgi:hypothetical protein